MHFDLPALLRGKEELELSMSEPGFWNDLDKSQEINRELKSIDNKINKLNTLKDDIEEIEIFIELGNEEDDESVIPEIEEGLSKLKKQVDEFHLSILFKGKYDNLNAIISLHAGAGGTESLDWVAMLLRMYTRWCESKGFKYRTLDFLAGDEAGVKSVTLLVEGENAYGYLKAEKGVHRLVRISPFDSSSRRHTTFASLDVMPELDSEISVDIDQDDLRIDTYRSSGAGGQHVNKTDSAVRITHLPTNIVVQCQNERSQLQNKTTAMKMLTAKLLVLEELKAQKEISDVKGELKKIEWGSQIRSYVFHPYSMVKDHRTNHETAKTGAVMDGDLDPFIDAYLKMNAGKK